MARGTLGGRDAHMRVVVSGGLLYGGISYVSLVKRTGASGYIHAEDCNGNTHMEVAVGGGPTWKDQGTCYEGNMCSGQGFDDIHAEQGEDYPQKTGERDTLNRGKRVGEVRLLYMGLACQGEGAANQSHPLLTPSPPGLHPGHDGCGIVWHHGADGHQAERYPCGHPHCLGRHRCGVYCPCGAGEYRLIPVPILWHPHPLGHVPMGGSSWVAHRDSPT